MSRTHVTMKARKKRQLNKIWLHAINNDRTDINAIDNENRSVLVNGQRYGNKRKYEAQTKVINRRRERKINNRQPLEE